MEVNLHFGANAEFPSDNGVHVTTVELSIKRLVVETLNVVLRNVSL